jgi:hypothetical protein
MLVGSAGFNPPQLKYPTKSGFLIWRAFQAEPRSSRFQRNPPETNDTVAELFTELFTKSVLG